MQIIQTIIALIITLGILVTIHEFGHFWVARRCGIKVLRFAWGFGKPLVTWKDRYDTEYTICALPLGGYVKMLDEREGPVAPDQLSHSFNRQSVGKRIAVASAGPVANFIFALIAYWVMFLMGSQVIVPVLGEIPPESAIARAGLESGLEIVAVDGKLTPEWSEVNLQLIKRLGDTGSIVLGVREPGENNLVRNYPVTIVDWLIGDMQPDPMSALGIVPFQPKLPAIIKEISPDGAAYVSGLQIQDKIIAVNREPVTDSVDFVNKIKNAPGQDLQLTVVRKQAEILLTVTPQAFVTNGETIGRIGVMLESADYPETHIRDINHGFFGSIYEAGLKTWDISVVILGSIKKMIFGQISVENLGGPITIANAAGASASYGIESFLNFLAYLSISLGVLNLLPIPILDGGHLLYYFVEVLTGKPLSEEIQTMGLKIGMAIIAIIMLFAFYNDLSRI